VYGLTELARERIRSARIVGVPGCYPTGALLGLVPLVRSAMVAEGRVVIDAKSGASGAGRSAKTELLFCEVDESLHAYGVGSHRHTAEIEQELERERFRGSFVFTPHLVPIRRGILTTIYVPLAGAADPEAAFRSAYAGEPFVRVLPAGVLPDVRDVRGTNDTHVGWQVLEDGRLAVVVTAIDNLGKGAAGQAVQDLNVMFGFAETAGLDAIAAVP
jgi:N-acetyl-gamma-glutamyl-phosphate reductase